MLARGSIARRSSQWLKSSSTNIPSRAFASPAINPFTYQLSDAAGIKVVSKDIGSPTSSLAVVVKAGSRYENAPGVAHGLQHYGFKVGILLSYRRFMSVIFTYSNFYG